MRRRLSTLIWSVALVVAVSAGFVLFTVGRAVPTAGVPKVAPPAGFRQNTPTNTVLTTSVASPVAAKTPVTLTATVSPATAAGTVQFRDGSANIGDPVTVTDGAASLTTSTLAAGSHQLGAVFTPANPSSFGASRSSPVPFVVSDAATTNTTLTTSAASPIAQNTALTLTATVSPATAAGTVQFRDGSTNLGIPVTVSGGTASYTATLAAGSHQLSAVFTPADPALYATSTSTPVPFVVSGATATNTTLTTSATTTPVVAGTSVTLTATINPMAAAGTVQFVDGTTNIGSAVTVANGVASTTTTTLAVGSRQLAAVFTPTDTALYGSSRSPAVTFVVSGATATATRLMTSPTSPVVENTPTTLTATLTPTNAVGTVQFRDGNTNLGGPVTVAANGIATQNATLGVGRHQLTAAFTPTTAAQFSPSTSTPMTYVVQARPLLAAAAAVVPGGEDRPGDVGPRPGRRGVIPGLGRRGAALR